MANPVCEKFWFPLWLCQTCHYRLLTGMEQYCEQGYLHIKPSANLCTVQYTLLLISPGLPQIGKHADSRIVSVNHCLLASSDHPTMLVYWTIEDQRHELGTLSLELMFCNIVGEKHPGLCRATHLALDIVPWRKGFCLGHSNYGLVHTLQRNLALDLNFVFCHTLERAATFGIRVWMPLVICIKQWIRFKFDCR